MSEGISDNKRRKNKQKTWLREFRVLKYEKNFFVITYHKTALLTFNCDLQVLNCALRATLNENLTFAVRGNRNNTPILKSLIHEYLQVSVAGVILARMPCWQKITQLRKVIMGNVVRKKFPFWVGCNYCDCHANRVWRLNFFYCEVKVLLYCWLAQFYGVFFH